MSIRRRVLVPALTALAVLTTAGPALAHHKPWHGGGPPWARPHHGHGYCTCAATAAGRRLRAAALRLL